MSNSNKEYRADNQQERLIGWITGFVDGEGCFSLGFVKQGNREEKDRTRKGYKTGYQVFHEFSVTQGASSIDSLKVLEKYFGVGKLYQNKRYDNHKEHLYRYVVRKRDDIMNVIIPFFQKNLLRTSKINDFQFFVEGMDLVNAKKHLSIDGMITIAKITEKMNHKKSKKDLISILRDQTSDSS